MNATRYDGAERKDDRLGPHVPAARDTKARFAMLAMNNQPISDLVALNAALGAQNVSEGPNPLATGNLSQTNGPSAAEIDAAIGACTLVLYDYIDTTDVVAAVDAGLDAAIGAARQLHPVDEFGRDPGVRESRLHESW